MQNTKIQALWQLTQELKEKRESLKEKLSYTQNYLDEQQLVMSGELHTLKQETWSLSQDLQTVLAQLQTLHSQWQKHQNTEVTHLDALQDRDQSFQDLILEFERLSAERQLIGALLEKADPEIQETASPLIEDFDTWYAYAQKSYEQHLEARVEQLEHPAEEINDSLEAVRQSLDFLAEFQPAWNESKSQIIESLNTTVSDSSPLDTDAMQAEVKELRTQYLEMENMLTATKAELEERKEAFHNASKSVDLAQDIQSEFEALRSNNQNLSGDLEKLESQTNQLIQLVETYRQVALTAASQAEDAESSDGDTPEMGSKSEVARDAIRKKIVLILRHRFGKTPRKVSNALKEISNNKVMDHTFDLALSAENIETFEAELLK